jgi:hypothetical protein
LIEGIKNYADHQIIETKDFFQGDWNFLQQISEKPLQKLALAKDGTETIAQEIVNYLNNK